MSTQISLKLSRKMMAEAKKYARSRGYDSLQDFIRELMRRKLFGEETYGGMHTARARIAREELEQRRRGRSMGAFAKGDIVLSPSPTRT